MTVNCAKIQCPECLTVYDLKKGQPGLAGKRTARCTACDKRFVVEFHGEDYQTAGGVSFLRSYFEKRNGGQRRVPVDRRRDEQVTDYIASKNLPNDVIPILNNKGDAIIGHISPGRRNGSDRRNGIERRLGRS
jgi:predicted Zn finger-like uncharacterized protein